MTTKDESDGQESFQTFTDSRQQHVVKRAWRQRLLTTIAGDNARNSRMINKRL